jgi:hypothetical protein
MRCLAVVMLLGLALSATASAELADSAKLKPDGLGRLKVGMSEGAVERVLGESIRQDKLGSCGTARLRARDYLMFTRDRLVRVSLSSPHYATRKGVRVGMRQGVIRNRYGRKAKRAPHAYNPDGFYFKVTYGSRRIVFETDGARITAIHGGRVPEVDYVEGCA